MTASAVAMLLPQQGGGSDALSKGGLGEELKFWAQATGPYFLRLDEDACEQNADRSRCRKLQGLL